MVGSSSVSTFEEADEAADELECTELSVELRSDKRESRILAVRKKSISGARVLGVVPAMVGEVVDDSEAVDEAQLAFNVRLVELCMGAPGIVATELVDMAFDMRPILRAGVTANEWR